MLPKTFVKRCQTLSFYVQKKNPISGGSLLDISTTNTSVPGAGLEPARLIQPTDFKSVMSTNSITRANSNEASAGFEPANGGFANRSLRPLGYDAI